MKFCTACQQYREEANGQIRAGKGFKRWMCEDCATRKTVSIYKTSGKDQGRGALRVKAMLEGRLR